MPSRGRLSLAVLCTIATGAATTASAQQPSPDPWAVRFESGLMMPAENLHEHGPGVGLPPPLYAGLTLVRDLKPTLAAEGTAGLSLLLGPTIGASLRYLPVATPRYRVSVGAGPLVAAHASFGIGAFLQAGITGEVRFDSGIVLAGGLATAYGLHPAGTEKCGTDTCDAWMHPGDNIVTLQAAIGHAF